MYYINIKNKGNERKNNTDRLLAVLRGKDSHS